jgi:Regulator of chromosome condensation (RCC1) repeat
MVWVWGDNKSATLGLNDYTNRTSPYLLAALKDKNISNIVFGNNFAFAYKNSNQQQTNNELSNLLSSAESITNYKTFTF